jgi:signal transduction histidine kinase/CheY-like chemotaxis protein
MALTETMAVAVRREQIRTLYTQSVPVLLANIVNVLVVSGALWSSESHGLLVGWTGLITVVTMARLELRRRFFRARPWSEEARRWGTLFVLGSSAAGLTWGIAGALLFDAANPLSQILVTFVIGGMVAGAAGTLSCYMPACLGFILLAVAPLAIRTLALGDPLHLAMGALLVVYAVAMSFISGNTNRSITEAFRLRFENDALLERLASAQSDLEETNRSLELRVAERTADLERQSEALRSAQRMEAVGRLAGGVAHDFNNLLTVVLANTDVLIRASRLEAEAREASEEIRGAAGRGAELVRQLLAFSRQQRLAPRVFDLHRVVGDMQRLLGRLIGERIDLRVALAEGPLLVNADPGQVEQVVINLVTNARDAMPEGGTLTITTRAIESGAGDALPALGGAQVVLSVSDTGVGMDAETRQHAFDPFFTTKQIGQGTGLGLATVHGIVEQSGGKIVVESRPGRGSRFDVYLPRARDSVVPSEAPVAPRLATLPATILLAEDERAVRDVIQRILVLAGHQVLAAEDGEHALALARSYQGPIDLLITDVVMRKLGGPELARQLAAERPRVRVLFVSGYTWDHTLPPNERAAGIDFLHKPFTPDSLTQKVSDLLQASPRANALPAGG